MNLSWIMQWIDSSGWADYCSNNSNNNYYYGNKLNGNYIYSISI